MGKNLDFELFLKVEIQHTANIKVSIRQHFINQSRLFLLLPKTKQATADQTRVARFRCKVANHFSPPPPPKSTPKKSSVRAAIRSLAVAQTTFNAGSSRPTRRQRKETARFTPDAADTSVVQPRKRTRATVKKTSGNQEQEDNPVTTDDVVMTSGTDPQEAPEIIEADVTEAFDDNVPEYLLIGARDPESKPGYVEMMKRPMPEESFRTFELFPEWRDDAIAKVKDILTITRLLRGIGIPYEHRAKGFFDSRFMIYMNDMMWILGTYKYITQISKSPTTEEAEKKIWEEAFRRNRSGLATGYFSAKQEEVKHRGYAVLESFADMSSIPMDLVMDPCRKLLTQKGDEMSGGVETLSYYGDTQQLFDFYMSTFPGEEGLRRQEDRELWNPIVNQGQDTGDVDNQDKGIGRFMSQRKLMMEYVERSSEKVWAAK